MSNNVVAQANADATPIKVILSRAYESWLSDQADAVQSWMRESGFKGESRSWAWVPGTDGPERIVAAVEKLSPTCLGHLPLALPEGHYRLDAGAAAGAEAICALSWGLGAYQFTRYRPADRPPATLHLDAAGDAVLRQLDAIYLVRDLINTPTNDMLPEQLEQAIVALANDFDAHCSAITGDDLLKENFPTIHAVGRASACAPRLIDLTWGDPADPAVVLIGKGVCFDSGGLDIKPAAGMRLMKKDMGGAAHAIGLARLIMSEQLPIQLRLLVPAVENAISDNAYRPGDVITTRKGITVEIDNTDAEGRLVLCDALALASEASPELMIDFATLTGAARTALGPELPAMFCNDDDLANGILEGAQQATDPLWRMPLHQPYKSMLDSNVADLANGAGSPYAGAITAALFLESFVASGIPWAHFDVMAWNIASKPGRPTGGEAMGLRAVYAYLEQRFAA
jgi:leucyl aminopeptidase